MSFLHGDDTLGIGALGPEIGTYRYYRNRQGNKRKERPGFSGTIDLDPKTGQKAKKQKGRNRQSTASHIINPLKDFL